MIRCGRDARCKMHDTIRRSSRRRGILPHSCRDMDLALINANVLTMDGSRPRAEGILIRGDRIARVGSADEVLAGLSREVPVIDLEGKTILPGFIDCHTHFVSYGVSMARLDFGESRSLSDAYDMIREKVRESEKGETIIGEWWDQSKWRENRYPTKEELDSLAADNPVVMRRVCGHLAIANSRALDLIAVDISGVDWERGILSGAPALNVNRLFPPSFGELLEGVQYAISQAHSLGVTSVHDIVTPEYLSAYQELQKRRELELRVYACFYEDYLGSLLDLGLRTQFGDPILKFGGIKIFADGSLGARSAALSSPYQNGKGGAGTLTHSDEELGSVMRKADDGGIQILTHAIGDRAVAQVLSGYEKILKGRPNELRHRIEHMEVITAEQLRRMKDLGIVASMQPNFMGEWGEVGAMYEEALGQERWRRSNPLREVADLGVHLALGSDSMPFSPLYGIHWAVNHPAEEQRLTVEQTIQFYTLGSAYASFDEGLKGSLEEGKLADLVVLGQDITRVESICEIPVELTILGGRIVYERKVD